MVKWQVLVPHPGGQPKAGFGTHRLGATLAISMGLTHGHLEGVGRIRVSVPALQSHVGTMGMQTGLEEERGGRVGWDSPVESEGCIPWGSTSGTSPAPHPAVGPLVSVTCLSLPTVPSLSSCLGCLSALGHSPRKCHHQPPSHHLLPGWDEGLEAHQGGGEELGLPPHGLCLERQEEGWISWGQSIFELTKPRNGPDNPLALAVVLFQARAGGHRTHHLQASNLPPLGSIPCPGTPGSTPIILAGSAPGAPWELRGCGTASATPSLLCQCFMSSAPGSPFLWWGEPGC